MSNDLAIRTKIKNCETAYLRCFCTSNENDQLVRFRDDQLPDMYDHNFTYLKNGAPKKRLTTLIQNEIQRNRSEKKTFVKFQMDEIPDRLWLEELPLKFELEHSGYYVYPVKSFPSWRIRKDCSISKVTGPAMIEELISMDLIHDKERCGEDFCIRRARRRGEIYLSKEPLDSYIIYNEGCPVGSCDLFLHLGTAKIEDFAVLPRYQRKGFGTTLLKCLIDIAISKGSDLIYLMTDEDDSPQEMYRKLRFKRECDSYALFYKF